MSSDVVTTYHEALSARDLDAARALLRDDLKFRGPFDTFTSADDYWATLTRLWGVVERVDVLHQSSSGDETVVIYDMVTKTPAGTQPIVEWLGVEDGRIAWIRTIFDTAPFAFLRSGQ
jgi:ketosteroid isomerase-like protein